MTTENFQLIETEKLVPYANNARTHGAEQVLMLRSSLREFGFVNPILVDANLNVIAGHGRLLAAKAEGYEKVPCVLVEHLTPAQIRAYIPCRACRLGRRTFANRIGRVEGIGLRHCAVRLRGF